MAHPPIFRIRIFPQVADTSSPVTMERKVGNLGFKKILFCCRNFRVTESTQARPHATITSLISELSLLRSSFKPSEHVLSVYPCGLFKMGIQHKDKEQGNKEKLTEYDASAGPYATPLGTLYPLRARLRFRVFLRRPYAPAPVHFPGASRNKDPAR
jgi:hypothetical protein